MSNKESYYRPSIIAEILLKLSNLIKKSYILSITIISLQTSGLGFAQDTEENLQQQLDNLIPVLMDENSIPGLALSIVGLSSQPITGVYGVGSVISEAAVTRSTVFEAASTAKPMFSWMVMKLIEKEVLALDEPLTNHLVFESIAEDPRGDLITARMVLNHTSGLPNGIPRGSGPSILFKPGSEYFYSGWGFRYLQQVVEKLTQESLTETMSEYVFTPMNMSEAKYLWDESRESIAADGHNEKGEFSREIVKLNSEYAEGGITTNIDGLSAFLLYMLSEYKSNSLTLDSMIKLETLVEDYGSEGSMWRGLGWAIENTPHGLSIWHGGSNGAFKAFLFLDLENEAGLAMLANGANGIKIVPDLVDTFFGAHHLFHEYYLIDQ